MADDDLAVPTLPNLRDVGGLATRDGGRVSRGLLFRSSDLSRLDAAGLAALTRLGIRAVFDLRTARESQAAPDRLPAGAARVALDVLRDSARLTPTDMERLLATPAGVAEALGGGRAETFFVDAYREFVELPSARLAYGRFLSEVAGADRRPALVHCTTGKDRTGWAVAVLLLALGVREDLVQQEYLRSGPAVAALFAPHLAAFAARGGDPELLRPLLEVRPAYLAASLGAMRQRYGTVEGYLADGLGVGDVTLAALRSAFVRRA